MSLFRQLANRPLLLRASELGASRELNENGEVLIIEIGFWNVYFTMTITQDPPPQKKKKTNGVGNH